MLTTLEGKLPPHFLCLIVNGIKHGRKKIKASRGVNKALTLAACFILPTIMTGVIVYVGIAATQNNWIHRDPFDDSVIPLSVTDFQDVDEDKYIEQNRNNETFLVSQRVVHMFGDWNVEGFHELPDLQYIITTVKVPFIYEWCKEQMFWDLDESKDTDIPLGHRIVLKEDNSDSWCKFRPSSHTCTDIQPRWHGISATPSRSGATVVRGAVTPLQPVNQALSQRAMIFLDCS